MKLVTDDVEVGSWPIEAVTIRRVGADRFDFTVEGDTVSFFPEEPGEFAQLGIPAVAAPKGFRFPAIASLVLSVVWIVLLRPYDLDSIGVVTPVLWAAWVSSILAVIFGHMALRWIADSRGKETGRKVAIVGLALGYLAAFGLPLGVAVDQLTGCEKQAQPEASETQPPGTADMLRADSLMAQAETSNEAGRLRQALASYGEVITCYRDATDPELAVVVAQALAGKGFVLRDLGRPEEGLAAFEEVIARYGDATDPGMVVQVARAEVDRGYFLVALGRLDEGLAASDEVIARYGDRPELAGQVARALLNKGVVLFTLGQTEEGLAAFDELVSRYGDSPDPDLAGQAARALYNKALKLTDLGRLNEASNTYREVLTRYGDRSDPGLVAPVASSLYNMGVLAADTQQWELAGEVYNEIIER